MIHEKTRKRHENQFKETMQKSNRKFLHCFRVLSCSPWFLILFDRQNLICLDVFEDLCFAGKPLDLQLRHFRRRA